MSDTYDPTAAWPRYLPYPASDIEQALPDWLALRNNERIENPDPLASVLIERNATLRDIAVHLSGQDARAELGQAQITRALSNSDFGAALTVAAGAALGTSYSRASNLYRQILKDIPTRGMRPADIVNVDLGNVELSPSTGGAATQPVIAIGDPATATPQLWFAGLIVSRELLVNDDVNAIAEITRQLAAAATKIEGKRIAQILDLNPDLADGDPLIGSSNTTGDTGLSATTLGQASAILLATETDSGAMSALPPRYLVVPPSQYIGALVLASTLVASGASPISIVPLPWLSDAAAYVLADPSDSPVLVRTYPASVGGEPLLEPARPISQGPDGEPIHHDGLGVRFLFACGIDAVSRTGIAKIALS